MDRGQAPVVAGIHGLKHIQSLAAAALADDNPVGAHAQRVADQVADRDRPLALHVRRTGFKPDQMLLMELEFGRVLNGDDAFAVRQKRAQNVQQRRLAGAGAA